ncbi:MAG: peptidase M19 [Epsilonproteobacteria bacterium]|nr:MAG: peptidase M19 [Campylobacterota bacterium]RLA65903.1 MAG: peptidase M19 [Campylobacterota bacterium]
MKKITIISLSLVVLFLLLPGIVDRLKNPLVHESLPELTAAGLKFHKTLFVADLHNDFLLWNRNLLKSYSYGHTDLPRMRKGNASLQVFSSVTKTPRGLNYHSNSDKSDMITLLSIIQRNPVDTWNSLLERSLYHSLKLHRYEKESQGELLIIKSKKDLKQFLFKKRKEKKIIGALLSIEGAHALEGKPENVDKLYQAGFRMFGLAHFFDNEVGGSAHGENKGGLTKFGEDLIKEMNKRHIIIDLAHSSDRVIDETLTLSQAPVVVSHTGVKGTCKGQRNLSDQQIKSITKKGGLIGIGLWGDAICGESVVDVVKAIKYVMNLVGVEHVALGSDFDGSVKTAIDVTGLPYITQELLNQGISKEDIKKIMGGNILNFLLANLPAS